MPTNTYTSLATITLTSADSEVVFSSIPATYRDLILVVEASTTASGVTLDLRFNSDTGSNYSQVAMVGRNNGASAEVGTGTAITILGNTFGTTPFQSIIQIQDVNVAKHKSVLARASSYDTSLSSYLVKAVSGRWASTATITTISVSSLFNSRSFEVGSTFSLYGVIA